MKKFKLALWQKILLVPVFIVLAFKIFFTIKNYAELLEQKKFIREHGQECIAKAVPIGDGEKFAMCDWSKGDVMGASFVVYDSSGQVALPSERRSDKWIYMFLKYSDGLGAQKLKAKKLDGDFYELVTGISWPSDDRAAYMKLKCIYRFSDAEISKTLPRYSLECNKL